MFPDVGRQFRVFETIPEGDWRVVYSAEVLELDESRIPSSISTSIPRILWRWVACCPLCGAEFGDMIQSSFRGVSLITANGAAMNLLRESFSGTRRLHEGECSLGGDGSL